MSRPSEIYSKTVSVRLPMDYYIDLLKMATNNKMSLSEYITMKLFENNTKQEKNKPKTDVNTVWELKNTFANKDSFSRSKDKPQSFTGQDVLNVKRGQEVISKDGKWKIIAVHKGLNQLWKAK